MTEKGIRIQKILARAGIASRRQCEQMIREGRVTLRSERIAAPGMLITPEQYRDLRVDGEKLPPMSPRLYIMLNKPEGFICSAHDPQGRPTVLDLLPRNIPRLFPVGRLDFRTEGLLLLTNDGCLAHRLLHPRFHVPKTYRVKVEGLVEPSSLQILLEGMGEGSERMRAERATVVRIGPRHTWLVIEVRQGRYRQIRRMCEAIGHPVLRLRRTCFGPLRLKGLPLGKWRLLRPREVDALRRYADLLREEKTKGTR